MILDAANVTAKGATSHSVSNTPADAEPGRHSRPGSWAHPAAPCLPDAPRQTTHSSPSNATPQ